MQTEEFNLFNPWRKIKEAVNYDGALEEFDKQPYQFFHPFLLNFKTETQGIFTLRGPRQVGKSTLLKLIIKKLLLKEKVRPLNVFYYPADRIRDFNELFRVLLSYVEELRIDNNSFAYIFIDEISSVAGWTRSIKQLADLGKLKKTAVFLTGSNALDLLKGAELMPGRKGKEMQTEIEILPLSFNEYVSLTDKKLGQEKKEKLPLFLPRIKRLFLDYLTTGGFLKSINEFKSEKVITPATFKLYKEWVIGDLLKAGRSEILALSILKRMFIHLSSPFSYYSVAEKADINSYMTVIDYLDILEKMFVVFKTNQYSIDQKQVLPQKNKKCYFFDPLIYNTFSAVIESYLDNAFSHTTNTVLVSANLPRLAENAVALHLRRKFEKLYFGKIKEQEVDFVGIHHGTQNYFEVKYQNNVAPKDFKYFSENQKEKLTVITKNQSLKTKNLEFVPLEIFLLAAS